jgi:hypothetical protein
MDEAQMSDPQAHAIVLAIPTTEMLDYFSGRKRLKLPEGAALTAFWRADSKYSQEATELCLRIEHPTFPAIAPGARIPTRRPKKVL